jgi:uncharacterized protein YfkK (UPF0435 family)
MNQALYILFGWALGLFSPIIVDFFKSYYRKREFVTALRVELEDLQFRLAISSLSLLMSHGSLDKDFAHWALQIVDRYSGYEPSEGVQKFLHQFLDADDRTTSHLSGFARAKEGVGSTLKTFQAKFLESNLTEVSKLPVKTQRRIHEIRNQLSMLNQDVSRSETYLAMTFGSSLSEANYSRVNDDLNGIYKMVQGRCKSLADRVGSILSEL